MKFSLFLLPAFIASALAGPIVQKREESLTSIVDGLSANFAGHKAAIESTLAGLPSSPSFAQRRAAVASVRTEISALGSDFSAASVAVRGVEPEEGEDVLPQLQVILNDLAALVAEILEILGLGGLLPVINGLLGAVNGLLVVLSPLLGGLGATLIGLLETIVGLLPI